MKTIKTLIGAAIIASVTLAGTAQADWLMDTIHPESADLFDHKTSLISTGQNEIVSLGDDNNQKVWSYEYEQYVDPSDFTRNDYADINEYMDANPTAAGSRANNVFYYNELAGEYHLQ